MSEDSIQDVFLHILNEFAKTNINTALCTITQGEFLILSIVRKHGDYIESGHNSINVTRLAERLDASTAAVSRTLRRLEENGYLERITDKNNRRHTYVKLTDAGQQVLDDEARHIGELAARVFTRMGSEKMKTLRELSDDLHRILHEEMQQGAQ